MTQKQSLRLALLISVLGILLLYGTYLATPSPGIASTKGEPFLLEGTYVYSCACTTVCPCMFGSPGTTDNCQFPLVLHVEKGHVGKVNLDGLTLIMLSTWGGKDLIATLKDGKARAAIYIDSKGTKQQQEALLAAYFTVRKTKYAEMKGPISVPIEFSVKGDRATVTVPGRLELEVERLRHQGKYIEITNVPYHITDHIYAGHALRHRLQDSELGLQWNYDGRNGDFGPFKLQGTVGAERNTWF